MLCALFARTKSLVPCILFHFFFNLASALSTDAGILQNSVMIGISLAVSLAYLAYLLRQGLPRVSGA
jgi:uncharacterized membrane protein YhfC